MSQSYDDFMKACTMIYQNWSTLGMSTHWEDVRMLESYGTCWMKILTRESNALINKSTDDEGNVDILVQADDEDPEALEKSAPVQDRTIAYEIIHSPSYQVPVLYLTVQGGHLPPLDEAYKILVPETHKSSMMSVSVMGALTLTEHPIFGIPAFFVHPCRTMEAMRSVLGDQQASPEQYLMLWLGLTGIVVGLSVPVELARSIPALPTRDSQTVVGA